MEELEAKYLCPIYADKKELQGLRDTEINNSKPSYQKSIAIQVHKVLSHGDLINVGDITLEIIHTPGGICLKVKEDPIIFTGDTIFSDDLGRTDLVGGSEDLLRKSITNKVSKWSDAVVIYPGHGEASSMEKVRRSSAFSNFLK